MLAFRSSGLDEFVTPVPGNALQGLFGDLLNATGSRWGKLTFEKEGAARVLGGNISQSERMAFPDPWLTQRPRILGRAIRGESFLPAAVWKASDYYQSILRPTGVEPDHSLIASVACAGGEIVAFLARATWDSPFSAAEQARLEMFLPMIPRVADLMWAAEAEREASAHGNAALDALTLGTVVVGQSGEVLYSNRAASLLVGTADWLSVVDGHITTVDPAQRERLEVHIMDACRPVAPRPALIRLPGRRGAWATVLVSPLRNDGAAHETARALVTLRASGEHDGRLNPIRLLFGLSDAEARLAWALVNGASVVEFAAARSVSVNTARVQLTSLLRKSGAKRQAELVALLGSIPPVRLSPGPLAARASPEGEPH